MSAAQNTMLKKWIAVLMCIAASVASTVADQALDASSLSETIRSIYSAREAEKRGDLQGAAQNYLTAISYLESSAPRDVDLSKVVICDEPVPNIGRRMIFCWMQVLRSEIANPHPTMSVEHCLKTLQSCYGKMAWIEKTNPTWP